MLHNLMIGLPVILICLFLQAYFLAICLRRYVKLRRTQNLAISNQWHEIRLLAMVMLVMLFGNYVQMAIWALVLQMLGEFEDFGKAMYFSGVTFSTLGYGDVVLSEKWRLLSPLEAGNGILMFGVTTSVMTAAVMDIIKDHLAEVDIPGRER